MKKHIGLLIAFISVFLIGASGVSAAAWVDCANQESCTTYYNEHLKSQIENMNKYEISYVITNNSLTNYVVAFTTQNNVYIIWSDKELYYNESTNRFYASEDNTKLFHYVLVDAGNASNENGVCYNSVREVWTLNKDDQVELNTYSYLFDSSYNVKNENGTVFFPPPQVIFPGIVEAILKPVIQIVIGLIPLVIGLVVFCLALRKGLQLLLKTLRQA